MTREISLLGSTLPDRLLPDEEITWGVSLKNTGDEPAVAAAALFDPNVGRNIVLLPLVTNREMRPGETVEGSDTFPSLGEWYRDTTGSPIPEALEWTPVCGWMDVAEKVLYITDEGEAKTIPVGGKSIIDRILEHKVEVATAAGIGAVGVAYAATR